MQFLLQAAFVSEELMYFEANILEQSFPNILEAAA